MLLLALSKVIQLLDGMPGKAAEGGTSIWAVASPWEIQMDFQTPSSGLAQSELVWPLGSKAEMEAHTLSL